MKLNLETVINGAVGPFDEYCDGYGNPGSSGLGYISVMTLSTGIVKKEMDNILDGIVCYDRAEAADAYIGQINMITASSFNGLNGAVWGYDLAKAEVIADGSQKPLFMKKRFDGVEIPVYSVEPLLNAGERLFGRNEKRRFPLLPGAQAICAVKDVTIAGPTSIWCAIAIAIAEDQERDSNLFIEDAGQDIPAESEEDRVAYLDRLMENIAESVALCGQDQLAKYKSIYLGYKTAWVPEGYVGSALTCAPYVVLAKDAIPKDKQAYDISKMTISEWEKEMGF